MLYTFYDDEQAMKKTSLLCYKVRHNCSSYWNNFYQFYTNSKSNFLLHGVTYRPNTVCSLAQIAEFYTIFYTILNSASTLHGYWKLVI